MARKRRSKIPPRISREPLGAITSSPTIIRNKNHWFAFAIVFGIFVLVFGFISITSFVQKSPTVDEPTHLFAGYSYLKWGDFRSNPEHPPLAKVWAALPLLAFDIKDPRPSSREWDLIPQYGPDALHTINVAGDMLFLENDAATLFFYTKLPMIAFGIILGLFVCLWSKELFGLGAAIVSLFLYCLDPNMLAHSQLVHTDMPFTTIFFIGTYFFWRALGHLTWPHLLLTSLFFGLLAITKYSYLAVFVVWGILGLMKIFSSQPQQCAIGMPRTVSTRWGKTALLTALLISSLITAYFFIWAAYSFRFYAIPGGEQYFPMTEKMPANPYLRALVDFLTQNRLFPEAWIYGQLHVFEGFARETYLLGQNSDRGFWFYFPVAFAVKTPLPTLFLVVGTVALWVSKGKDQKPGLFLFLPIVVYFSLAVWSRMNIGLRHILPIYPFLFVLVGGTAAELWKASTPIKRGFLVALGLWSLWSSLSIYPHYLAFFNELVGGAQNGHKVLLDSNLDWGQDLKGLKRWMDDNEVRKIQFLYFGFYNIAAPEYYKIDARYLPGSWIGYPPPIEEGSATPNYVAISANHLYGTFLKEGQEEFSKPFRQIEPITTIGYSIFIYKLDEAIERYRRLIEVNPNSAEAHNHLAVILENQGRIEEAIQYYRRAVQINPAYAEARYKLAVTLTLRGEFEEATQHLRKVLELKPLRGLSKTHFYLGTAFAMQGHLGEAKEHYLKALEISPKFIEAHHSLGRVMAARHDLDGAIEHFREAVRIQPGFAEAHESLGRALAQQGKGAEALQHYQEALRILKSRR